MNRTIACVIAVSAVCVGAASANSRISDAQYIALSRCAAIAQGLDQDGEVWAERLQEARIGRSTMAIQRAQAEENQARRSLRRADNRLKAELAEELQGRCARIAPAA